MMNKKIMYDVKDQLLDIKLEKIHDERINKCVILLNYLNETKLEEIKPVIDIFSNGILDDCDNEKTLFDDRKYFNLLFPTVKYEIIPIKKSQKIKDEKITNINNIVNEIHVQDDMKCQESNATTETSDNDQHVKIIDDYYADIQPDTTQVVELKDNNDPIIFYKENNTCNEPIVVFLKYESYTFKKINFETSLANSILENVVKTYNLNKTTKDKIKQMLDDNYTIEQVKNDETFNLSPFIIKVNDNSYDVYIKNHSTEIIEGLLYNSYKNKNELKYVGNYGFLLL